MNEHKEQRREMFVVPLSFYTSLHGIADESKGRIYQAVCEYGFFKQVYTQLNDYETALFKSFLPVLDRYWDK